MKPEQNFIRVNIPEIHNDYTALFNYSFIKKPQQSCLSLVTLYEIIIKSIAFAILSYIVMLRLNTRGVDFLGGVYSRGVQKRAFNEKNPKKGSLKKGCV